MADRRNIISFPHRLPRSPSSHFRQYADLMMRLHDLMREDRDDGLEGDALRDAMDGPWYKLTEEEVHLVDELSAQLYELWDRRRRPEPEGPPLSDDQFRKAWEERDWRRLLASFPALVKGRPKEQEWNLKAHIWEWVGVPRAAGRFFQESARTGGSFEQYFYMNWLIRSGDMAEAEHIAAKLLQLDHVELDHRLHAAIISFAACIKDTPPSESGRTLRRFSQLFSSILEADRASRIHHSLRALALLNLASIADQRGRHDEARDYLDRARKEGLPEFLYRLSLGISYYLAKQYVHSCKEFTRARATDALGWSRIWLAHALLAQGKTSEAKAQLHGLLRINAVHKNARVLSSTHQLLAYLEQCSGGAVDIIVEHLEAALEATPGKLHLMTELDRLRSGSVPAGDMRRPPEGLVKESEPTWGEVSEMMMSGAGIHSIPWERPAA